MRHNKGKNKNEKQNKNKNEKRNKNKSEKQEQEQIQNIFYNPKILLRESFNDNNDDSTSGQNIPDNNDGSTSGQNIPDNKDGSTSGQNISDNKDGSTSGQNISDLKNSKFISDYKNSRKKTVLQLDEVNYTIFSDMQICSILDSLIYDDHKENFEKNIKPILEILEEEILERKEIKNRICDFQSINLFFQFFGFQESKNPGNNIKIFLDLVLPFISYTDEDNINEYIKNRINGQKSFYSWRKAGFDKEYFRKFEKIDSLKEKEMSIEKLLIIHNVGIALNIKFTNVYIQLDADKVQIESFKAFDLGNPNSNNRIFIGLYKEGEGICFFIPTLAENTKNQSVQYTYIQPPNFSCAKRYVFLPNYGPVYLFEAETMDVDYFQIYCNNSNYQIKYNEGPTFESQKMETKSYFNNDFPIYIKSYQKQSKSSNLTFFDKIRSSLNKNEKKIFITYKDEDKDKKLMCISKMIFNFATMPNDDKDIFTESDENSIKCNLVSQSDSISKNEYLLHLMTPRNIIPNLPAMKISSSFLEIVDIKINSLSRIFFIAKFVNKVTEKTNVFFGDGDFGSSKLEDMYICPKIIETNEILSTFIFSGDAKFDKEDIYSLPPGIIILHSKNEEKIITHYTRTNHKWKLEKEFSLKANNIEDAHIFFYSFKYVVIYKADNKWIGEEYSYLEKDPTKIDFKLPETFKTVFFTNEKIHFKTEDNKIIKITGHDEFNEVIFEKKEKEKEENEEEDEDEVYLKRINDLFVEDIDYSKRYNVSKTPLNNEPFPVAFEINQRVHVLKAKTTRKSEDENIKSPLYHPANRNSILKYSILSMFYRYRTHFHHEIEIESSLPYIIHANIDCSYYGDFNSIFKSSTSPGIYTVVSENSVDFSYGHKWITKPVILYTYFHNGKMQTGLTERRTLCQLAAAFSCAYAISVYTSSGKIICYEPPNQNTIIWTKQNCIKMEKNLVATYGTLLEMKNDYEFEFALNVLETTRDIVPDFKNFLHSLSMQ